MSDDGAVSAIVVALLALVGLLTLAVADAANVLVARVGAQNAADAAALAAAAEQWPVTESEATPAGAAAELAAANGAELVSCDCPERGEEATVVVSVRTPIRMLGVAPSEVRARATSALDVSRVFER